MQKSISELIQSKVSALLYIMGWYIGSKQI